MLNICNFFWNFFCRENYTTLLLQLFEFSTHMRNAQKQFELCHEKNITCWDHMENLMWTHIDWNLVGTYWEHQNPNKYTLWFNYWKKFQISYPLVLACLLCQNIPSGPNSGIWKVRWVEPNPILRTMHPFGQVNDTCVIIVFKYLKL
jgi:hypothetical protein